MIAARTGKTAFFGIPKLAAKGNGSMRFRQCKLEPTACRKYTFCKILIVSSIPSVSWHGINDAERGCISRQRQARSSHVDSEEGISGEDLSLKVDVTKIL